MDINVHFTHLDPALLEGNSISVCLTSQPPAEVHLVTSESYSSVNKEIIYQPFSIRIIGP